MKKMRFIVLIALLLLTATCCLAFAACDNQVPPIDDGADVTPPNQNTTDPETPGPDTQGPDTPASDLSLPEARLPNHFARQSSDSLTVVWSSAAYVGSYRAVLYKSSDTSTELASAIIPRVEGQASYSYTFAEEYFTTEGLYLFRLYSKGEPGVTRDNANYQSLNFSISKGVFPWIPLEISTKQQLFDINDNPKGHYVLTADINMQGAEMAPLGFANGKEHAFSGSFDGAGHTISNFSIRRSSDSSSFNFYYTVGLFGQLMNATVKNLTISNMTTQSPDALYPSNLWVGTLAGTAIGSAVTNVTVTNSSIDWSLYNNMADTFLYIGGLFGATREDTTITDCVVDVDIAGLLQTDTSLDESGQPNVSQTDADGGRILAGGIIGCANITNTTDAPSTITRTSYTGTMTITSFDYSVGGLVGSCYPIETYEQDSHKSPLTITDSYAAGKIEIVMKRALKADHVYHRYAGYLVGYSNPIVLERVYTTMLMSIDYNANEDEDNDYVSLTLPTAAIVCTCAVGNSTGLPRRVSGVYYLVNSESAGTNGFFTFNNLVNSDIPLSTIKNTGAMVSYSNAVPLTAEGFGTELNFTDWDFENVWQMTTAGPALR